MRHGLLVSDILKHNNYPHLVAARAEAMAILHTETKFSLAQIGRFFGQHHTTVFNQLRKRGLVQPRPEELVDWTIADESGIWDIA